MSGNAAIIASNQNHQCSITPSGAELKCGCRVVVMGNLCLLNCGNVPMFEGYVGKHHVAILCDAVCSGTIVKESLVEPSEFSEDKHTLMMINRSLIQVPTERKIPDPYNRGSHVELGQGQGINLQA